MTRQQDAQPEIFVGVLKEDLADMVFEAKKVPMVELQLEFMEPMPPTDLEACPDPGKDLVHAIEEPAEEAAPELGSGVLRAEERARVAKAKRGAKSAHTRRNYKRVFDAFTRWCEARGETALPADPDLVEAYLTELAEAGYTVAYLRAIWAGIRHHHRQAGHVDVAGNPSIPETISGLARDYLRPQNQAKGITESVQAAIEATACQRRPIGGRGGRMESMAAAERRGLQDIALIRTMRDGLLRRSEASALTWDDLEIQEDGSGRLRIVKSKTDPEGKGRKLYLGPRCIEALMVIRPANPGPGESIFGLSGSQICRRLRAAALHAGLGDGFSGHSPRVGMCQDLSAGGADTTALMIAGRWRTPAMPMRYSENMRAARGAVAKYYQRRGEAPMDLDQEDTI